jgi:predicted ABC-type transport system involved in lysophospholipase L1 biosynthesis ATPase subunit
MQMLNEAVLSAQPTITQDPYLVIDNVSKVYPTPTGSYTVLENINLTVKKGSLSASLVTRAAANRPCSIWWQGFRQPTEGEVRLQTQPFK